MRKATLSAVQRGFTLVEAILVIVILGVVGGMVAVFIKVPVQGYADSVQRAELSDVADLALRRMARDLRLALPNSIRVGPAGESLELLITRTGGRYLAAEDGIDTLPVLDFINPGNTTFTVVSAMPTASQLTLGSDYLVVNNLGPGYLPANAYDLLSTQRNITRITGMAASSLDLADNPFAAQTLPMPSPDHRFHIVSGPVTYYCALEPDGVTRLLTRQSGYPIRTVQVVNPVPAGAPAGTRSVLAGRVKNCQFRYAASMANQRSALVSIELELQARNSTETVRLVHQVHVDNTP